jgi:hypothetical protein
MDRKHLTMALTAALALSLLTAAVVDLCAHRVQADGSLGSPFGITFHDPAANAVGVALNASVQATFDDDVDASTVTSATFVLHGHLGGLASGTFSCDGGTRTVTLEPDRAFHAGELLRVSATGGISSAGAAALAPYGWQFTAGDVYPRSVAGFIDTGAGLTGVDSSSVAWGDYDNDGDLDIVLSGWADGSRVSKVYRNDAGAFADISAGLIGLTEGSLDWGDYDNDGDLDILLTGHSVIAPMSQVYRNDGGGAFSDISAGLTGVFGSSAAWGDCDNDGDLDILLTGTSGLYPSYAPLSKVYRNDTPSGFTDIGAALTAVRSSAAAWGDYDNDGDLDILLAGLATDGRVSKVYRNDGVSGFSDIGAGLTGVSSGSVAWGDVDHDGDLDILLTGHTGVSEVSQVYRNDGSGVFTDIGAALAGVAYGSGAWGDCDNDGDLDIVLTGLMGSTRVSKVYRNDGLGAFTDIGAGLTPVTESAVAWGDAEGDGDLDILLTGQDDMTASISRLYRNNSRPALGAVTPSSGSGPVGATTTFTTTWRDTDGWGDLKQCYFHIGESPALPGNVTLLYNAVKDKLWMLDDTGSSWLGGCNPGQTVVVVNSQAELDCGQTTVQRDGDTLSVAWAIEFQPGFEGSKKLGLKCKDRDRAKAKGKWKGSWTITNTVTAEGTLTRAYVSICQARETHYLPESGLYLYSDSVHLHAYEGHYISVRGWWVPSPECELVNVTEVLGR